MGTGYQSPSAIQERITPANEQVVRDWLDCQSSINTARMMGAGFDNTPETYEAAMRHFKVKPVIPD